MLKKSFLVLLMCVFSLYGFNSYSQTVNKKELEKKIKELQEQIADLEDSLDEISDRVDKNEQHTVMDKVNFSYELRTRADSLHYSDIRVMPNWASSMMQLWAFNRLVVPVDQIGGVLYGDGSGSTFNPAFAQTYGDVLQGMMEGMVQMGFVSPNGFVDMNGNGQFDQYDMPSVAVNSLGVPYFSDKFGSADLPLYQMMFNGISPDAVNNDNAVMYSTRLRINMESVINDNLKFVGRLTMYKTWGDGADVKFYNGQMNTMLMDGFDASVPTDDKLRVERAFFTYSGDNWHFSMGRRPSTDGLPMEYRNYSVVGGSPMATIINWQFDGISLGFNLEDKMGIPGFSFKLCYGVGFESGWGNSYSAYNNPDVKDVHLLGFISNLYRTDKLRVTLNYAHAFDVTDGFTGTVVMPFIVNGVDINGDGKFDEYYLTANRGGYISRNQPSANIGTFDLATLVIEGKYNNFQYFFSYSVSFANPSGTSKNPMMVFWGKDALLNDNGGQEKHSGNAVWAGLIYDFANGSRLGIEYNHGSKYWFNFTGAEDNVVGSKAAVRGDVYEIYYIYPFFGQKFFLTTGYQHYDYEYTGSGSPLGAPKKIENVTAFDTLMPVFDKIDNIYLSLTVRY